MRKSRLAPTAEKKAYSISFIGHEANGGIEHAPLLLASSQRKGALLSMLSEPLMDISHGLDATV